MSDFDMLTLTLGMMESPCWPYYFDIIKTSLLTSQQKNGIKQDFYNSLSK